MIIKCNRILLPPEIEEDDPVVRESKIKNAAKYIRKRKFAFHIDDIEKIGQHEDTRFVIVWFYYNAPEVIEYNYDELEKLWEEYQNTPDEEQGLTYFIPAN